MDVGAIKAAAVASAASYRSFADATRAVLDLLERVLPDATLYLAHLDRTHAVHRIVDTRGGAAFGLRSNLATPLGESHDLAMIEGRAPRCSPELPGGGSYLGVPLELSDGAVVGALVARSTTPGAFQPDDEQLFTMLAHVLAYELERESNERDLKRMNDTLRDHARGMGALGRVVRVLAGGEDARRAVCRAACEIAGAPVAFLLEPSGREFVSTAMSGVELPPVTIHPRPESSGRAFTARESHFVLDARQDSALAAPLVEATSARSALFEPVLRDGAVAGVLIVIWTLPLEGLPEGAAGMLRLLAAQAAVAIEHASLRTRMDALALTDVLTGVASRRLLSEELPRELARARRTELPVALALIDLDHLGAFNLVSGEREGDRLIKETASLWRNELREVDLLARLGGGRFALVLPGCDLSAAIDVLDRVRATTPRAQTASAGVARWDGEEPVELLVLRAEGALTAAKQSGRDATIAAD